MRGTKPQMRTNAKALAKSPPAPSWLSGEGKKEWQRIMPLLIERRTITDADLGVVESYCAAIGKVRQCERQINKDGLTIQTPTGTKRHPLLGVQNAAMTTARQCAAELGLTPVSRSRPSIREDSDDDDASPLDI